MSTHVTSYLSARSFALTHRPFQHHATRLACAVALALPAWPIAASAPNAPDITVQLHPAAADQRGAIPFIDVSITVEDMTVKKGASAFSIPKEVSTTKTNAERITDLNVEDSRGAVPLTVKDVVQGSADQLREWHAGRDASGRMRIHYRVALDADKPPFGGPMLDMLTGDGSFSGAGAAFLILPADTTPRTLHVRWELPSPSSKAASSLGFGDATSMKPLTPKQIGYAYFMEGDLGQYQGKNDQFLGAWTGSPRFAADQAMQWTESLHQFYAEFFADNGRKLVVFSRPNPFNPGSGLELTDSLAITYGPRTTVKNIQSLLAHEMVHTEIPAMDADPGDPESLATTWFEEGIAVYYQSVLPLRAGLIDRKAFLEDVNAIAAQYFTNTKRDSSNAQAVAGFWLDSRWRLLPYNRGAMYFAKLDALIRARSGGTRSVDDVIRTMLAERHSGKPFNEALWQKVLLAEAGPQGMADYQAMLKGELVLPPSDAYGPCFRRVIRKTRPFDMGFATGALLKPPLTVGRMEPGSEAEKAGLREGDVVVKGQAGDGTMIDQAQTITLKVKRGDQTFDVTYLPRGAPVDTYQWEETRATQCGAPPA